MSNNVYEAMGYIYTLGALIAIAFLLAIIAFLLALRRPVKKKEA